MEQNRGEGTQRFEKRGQAGSRGGCLKKGGPGNPCKLWNRPAGSVVSFKICQGLKCKHVVTTLTLKVVSATFLLVYFLCLKGSTCETRKNDFFHLKSSFCSWDIRILTFQIIKWHDIIKCPSMKCKTHFIE